MNEFKWWHGVLGAVVITVILVCMTISMHLEQVEKTKRDLEWNKTLQMQEETRQLKLKAKE